MLTREQLQSECRKIFDALPDRGETIDGVDDAVLKLNQQARMAIDLAAKLDKIREIAEDALLGCNTGVSAYDLMAILDEKGE